MPFTAHALRPMHLPALRQGGVACGDNQHLYILERDTGTDELVVYKKDLRSGSQEEVTALPG